MLKHLVEPWPADWLDFQLDSFEFKEPTKCLLRQMIPWQDLLQRTPPATQPEIHLFMDGSWLEKKSVGGYAVVAAVAIPGMQAILGMWGERQWPPAYLWVLQGCAYLSLSRAVLHYDCLAAGMATVGAWRPINELGRRTHALEQLLREFIPLRAAG